MAYDPYSTDERPVAARMPEPDYMGESDDGPMEQVTYKAMSGAGRGMTNRPMPVAPDTEEQLEDWLRTLAQQDQALQAEHTETLDQLSAIQYRRATLEARITTIANTATTVAKILDDHRRQMSRAGDELENRRMER